MVIFHSSRTGSHRGMEEIAIERGRRPTTWMPHESDFCVISRLEASYIYIYEWKEEQISNY